LQAATAALAAAGYRAAREAHHYRVIQSLAHTIQADPGLITSLEDLKSAQKDLLEAKDFNELKAVFKK